MSHHGGKPTGRIYSTTNYDMFKYRKDNRPIKESNVLSKIESIRKMGLRQPICVDNMFRVTDGQHRLEACKRLKIEVRYIIDDYKMSTYALADLQSATKPWSVDEYTHTYAQKDTNYRLYQDFCKKYPQFSHTCRLSLLTDKHGRTNIDEVFKQGLFEIKSIAKASTYADQLIKLGEFYKGYNKRSFVYAFMIMQSHPDFDFDRLMRKMPKRCRDIKDFSQTKDFLDVMQNIYNWKETKRLSFT